MANADVKAMRDAAEAELQAMRDDLEEIQAEARVMHAADEKRAAVVARIKLAKLAIATKCDEYGELARAAALVAGGTNHRPPR